MNETTILAMLKEMAQETTQEIFKKQAKGNIKSIIMDVHNDILLMEVNLRAIKQTLNKIDNLDDLNSLEGYLTAAKNLYKSINEAFQDKAMVNILEKYNK